MTKTKKLLGNQKYSKIPASIESAIQYMVNKVLIAGTYNFIDSTGNSKMVKFTNDGEVTGINGFSNYYINTDFDADLDNHLDEIIMNLHAKNQKDYAFTIKGNSIFIYDEIGNISNGKVTLGKLKYKLVKK